MLKMFASLRSRQYPELSGGITCDQEQVCNKLAMTLVKPSVSGGTTTERNEMGNLWHGIRVSLWIAVFLIVLLVAVIPQDYIPEWLTPVVTATGRFVGEEVRLKAPVGKKSELAATIRIQLDQGVCLVQLKRGKNLVPRFSIGDGTVRDRKPSGSELVLDPQGNVGAYEIIIGPEWHLFAPKGRRFVVLPMAIGMMAALAFRGRLRSLARKLGTRRVLFLAAIPAISGFVLYPAVHEGGHMVAGILFGAKANWGGVVWTGLAGEEPHASFSHLPESAVPFMAAGGTMAPMLIALLLLLIWRCAAWKRSWYLSAALVFISVLFLFSSVGCLFDLFRNSHMDALSLHYGLTGFPRVLLSLSPLLMAIAAFAWLGMVFWKSRLRRVITTG